MATVVVVAAGCSGIATFAAGVAAVDDDHVFVVERETFESAVVAGGVADVAIFVFCDSAAAAVVIVVFAAIVATV